VVRRVFEHDAYADRALRGAAAGLEPRERSLATQLVFGTIQRRATLDHFIALLAGRAPEDLEPPVRAALRLGLFQLLLLDGVAEHAAVNESVELAKRFGRGGAGLVNAVLRRAARERAALLGSLDDATPAGAAVRHSVPEWLAQMWWEELGPAEARQLLAAINRPAEAAVRVNLLRAHPAQVLERLPVAAHPAPELPEGLVLDEPFDAHGSELFAQGAIMPQSRGSMRVSRVLSPHPGERVLDLCAAPGAKTTHLAALMQGTGEVVAIERHGGRARALRATCGRMGADVVRVVLGDAAQPRADGTYAAVLVDPPCSGLGTLSSRPDLRWRATPERIEALAALQAQILACGAAATAPGGALVYSLCTISRREGSDVVEAFLGAHAEWSLDGPPLQLLPHRDGTDGFFIARLRRG
jgi:16S rRNA (cytosine967-C5)-methyltransferase